MREFLRMLKSNDNCKSKKKATCCGRLSLFASNICLRHHHAANSEEQQGGENCRQGHCDNPRGRDFY